jgi:hypothetical protein
MKKASKIIVSIVMALAIGVLSNNIIAFAAITEDVKISLVKIVKAEPFQSGFYSFKVHVRNDGDKPIKLANLKIYMLSGDQIVDSMHLDVTGLYRGTVKEYPVIFQTSSLPQKPMFSLEVLNAYEE